MSATKIRIVRDPGPGRPFKTTRITCVDPVAALTACGFDARFPGSRHLALREELTRLPTIPGYVGPLWDGDAVCYQDAAVAAALSR